MIRGDVDLGQQIARVGNGKPGEIRQGKQVFARDNFVIESFRLKTSAIALWTSRVGAIAAEQYAHVHFVNLRFEPAKESADTVPTIILVLILSVFTTALLAVDDKVLTRLRQFVQRNIDVDLFAGPGTKEIFLRFTQFVTPKNPNPPSLHPQPPSWNRF